MLYDKFFTKVCSTAITFIFLSTSLINPQYVYAQNLNLPLPGTFVTPTSQFNPTLIKGVNLNVENPLQFNFIIDQGDATLSEAAFKEESTKLVKYFLAALTIPEKEMWVNLSPYEKNRIIPEEFGKTEMGRDLLAQDYMLKQLTASLMYPEDELGAKFWKRVKKKAQAQFGTNEIPMNTFNKIWIVPQTAEVYEHEKGAFIVDSYLKVMLEEDYIALEANKNSTKHGLGDIKEGDLNVITGVSAQVVKEILIPEIEKEVNEGQIFANLRQVYNSVILASWYKQALKESLLGEIYVDQHKTLGVEQADVSENQKIYDQYVEAFKQGVYDIIKEEYDPAVQQVSQKKYFSGGVALAMTANHKKVKSGPRLARAMSNTNNAIDVGFVFQQAGQRQEAAAMLTGALWTGILPLASFGRNKLYHMYDQFRRREAVQISILEEVISPRQLARKDTLINLKGKIKDVQTDEMPPIDLEKDTPEVVIRKSAHIPRVLNDIEGINPTLPVNMVLREVEGVDGKVLVLVQAEPIFTKTKPELRQALQSKDVTIVSFRDAWVAESGSRSVELADLNNVSDELNEDGVFNGRPIMIRIDPSDLKQKSEAKKLLDTLRRQTQRQLIMVAEQPSSSTDFVKPADFSGADFYIHQRTGLAGIVQQDYPPIDSPLVLDSRQARKAGVVDLKEVVDDFKKDGFWQGRRAETARLDHYASLADRSIWILSEALPKVVVNRLKSNVFARDLELPSIEGVRDIELRKISSSFPNYNWVLTLNNNNQTQVKVSLSLSPDPNRPRHLHISVLAQDEMEGRTTVDPLKQGDVQAKVQEFVDAISTQVHARMGYPEGRVNPNLFKGIQVDLAMTRAELESQIPNAAESPVKAILFDYGNVFRTIDYGNIAKALHKRYGVDEELANQHFAEREIDANHWLFKHEKNQIGIPEAKEGLQAWIRKNSTHKNLTLDEETFVELLGLLFNEAIHEMRDMLEIAVQKGYQVKILTTTNPTHYKYVVQDIAALLPKGKDDILSSHIRSFDKRKPEIFKELVVELGLQADEILFIDDVEANTEAASSTGMRTVYFNIEQPIDEKVGEITANLSSDAMITTIGLTVGVPTVDLKKKKVHIIGAKSFLGDKLAHYYQDHFREVAGTVNSTKGTDLEFPELDLTDDTAIKEYFTNEVSEDDIVIYAAAVSDAGKAEKNSDLAFRLNATAIREIGKHFQGKFVYYSTDYVFVDSDQGPFRTTSVAAPKGTYSESKFLGEQVTFESFTGDHKPVIIRLGELYGHTSDDDRDTVVKKLVDQFEAGATVKAPDNVTKGFVSTDDVARATMVMLEQDVDGVQHVSGPEEISKYEFALSVGRIWAEMTGKDNPLLVRENAPKESNRYLVNTVNFLPDTDSTIRATLMRMGIVPKGMEFETAPEGTWAYLMSVLADQRNGLVPSKLKRVEQVSLFMQYFVAENFDALYEMFAAGSGVDRESFMDLMGNLYKRYKALTPQQRDILKLAVTFHGISNHPNLRKVWEQNQESAEAVAHILAGAKEADFEFDDHNELTAKTAKAIGNHWAVANFGVTHSPADLRGLKEEGLLDVLLLLGVFDIGGKMDGDTPNNGATPVLIREYIMRADEKVKDSRDDYVTSRLLYAFQPGSWVVSREAEDQRLINIFGALRETGALNDDEKFISTWAKVKINVPPLFLLLANREEGKKLFAKLIKILNHAIFDPDKYNSIVIDLLIGDNTFKTPRPIDFMALSNDEKKRYADLLAEALREDALQLNIPQSKDQTLRIGIRLPKDGAMVFRKGGIDMNPAMINMSVDGQGVVMPVTPESLRNINVDGLVPVLIHVQPITNLPLLLGLVDTPEDETPVDIGKELEPVDKREILEQVLNS